LHTLFASRVLLESVVRELLRSRANVRLMERHAAEGLVVGDDGARVTGLRVQARDGGAVGTLAADLVVDASGRGSHAPAWLAALGLPAPADTVVDAFVGYSTRWFQAPPLETRPADWWWKGIWIDPEGPHDFRAAVLFPVEGGRWIVTLGGLARRYPPADEAGFMAALATQRSPLIAEAVRHATPLSPVYCHRQMANRFRHWERWPARLAGFLAVGDAVSAFNPVYGQGMTCAAFAAGILARCLDAVGPTSAALPRRFFAAQAAFLGEPWALATGADFRYATTRGPRPRGVGLLNPYLDLLFTACVDDPAVRQRVGEVIHMLRRPLTLLDPSIAARAALSSLRRRLNGTGRSPIPAFPPAPAVAPGAAA
jgi:2-polyprenyl-6-methoxyphenol hydroxylase-like FAD-dependent oxidoreductase